MSDPIDNVNLILASVVLAGVRNHSAVSGNNGDWVDRELSIIDTAVKLRPYITDRSLVSRTLMSVPIYATIQDIVFEESSQRYIIAFVADKQPDNAEEPQVERIRSDRVDSRFGDVVKRLWSDKVGKHVCIYKLLEATDNPTKPSVRVCPYVHELNF